MKKTICISGNCVTEALPLFLKTNSAFDGQFEIRTLKPVFMLTDADIDGFKKEVSNCDVFITMPIGGPRYKELGIDTETIKTILKPSARLVLMPVPFFAGYFPEQFYLHDKDGILVGNCKGLPSPYHNKLIFYGYVQGLNVRETLRLLYHSNNAQNIVKAYQDSISELQRREQGLDFAISDFIASNFRKTRLFWTLNHPTNALLRYISQEILKILVANGDLNSDDLSVQNIPTEYLGGYVTPILPSTQRQLKLSWANCDNAVYTEDFIKACYDYYNNNKELVELNMHIIDDINFNNKTWFRKYHENNRKYCELFGMKIRYGKVPYSKRTLDEMRTTQNNMNEIKSHIIGVDTKLRALAGKVENEFCAVNVRIDNANSDIVGIQHQVSDLDSAVNDSVGSTNAEIKSVQEQINGINANLCQLQSQYQKLFTETNAIAVSVKSNFDKVQQSVDALKTYMTGLHKLKDDLDKISWANQQQTEQTSSYVTMFKTQLDFIQKEFPVYLAAQIEHQKVFPKYRNCNKGKDMVLLASGPTLDDYTAQKNVLFMGVNKSFMANKADLDYLFVQDLILDVQDKIDEYKGHNCKKFYGVHNLVPGIAQSHADKANAERYYFIDMNMLSPWPFPVDCSTMPFNTYSSVVHPAAVFALWTGVKKLYLVGCDTNMSGYFGKESKNYLCVDNVMHGWQKFKEFAATWYPETEIISVNPVGLRGLFHDVYTKSYLEKCSDILDTKPEILKQ